MHIQNQARNSVGDALCMQLDNNTNYALVKQVERAEPAKSLVPTRLTISFFLDFILNGQRELKHLKVPI